MKIKFAVLASLALASPQMALAKKKPQLTPMEIQALQSREYETTKETLFSSVMTVFADLGYQIENADMQTGFITANSATENKTSFIAALARMQVSGNTRATAYVEKMANGMAKVRLNFLSTTQASSGYGQQSRNDKPILDPMVYRTAWDKIDEALFVRQAIDAPARPAEAPPATTQPPAK
jgi:hypothetical protein